LRKSLAKISLTVLAALSSASAGYAVEAHYNVGLEIKPLPILMTSLAGGQGLGLSFELTSSKYDNWVFVTTAEAYKGPRNDDGLISEDIENNALSPVEETDYMYQQIGFGIRAYSNRQDDSYYVGGDFSIASEVQSFEVSESSYDIVSQSYRPNLEAGYRWVWENGTIFRLGAKLTYVTNINNRFDGEEADLPAEWRDDFVRSLDEAEQNDDLYANIDVGLGLSF